MREENWSDFDEHSWCKDILKSDEVEIIPNPGRKPGRNAMQENTSNSMFSETLWTDRAVRAYVSFRRKASEGDAKYPHEYCILLSLGDGLDGMKRRAHGGFNALVIDQIAGTCATYSMAETGDPPATATLAINYHAPIKTPTIILARATISKIEGRKVTVRARIEDGLGRVFAEGEALYITPRPKI